MSLVESIPLIDEFKNNKTEIMGKWYFAKPYGKKNLITKIMHAMK